MNKPEKFHFQGVETTRREVVSGLGRLSARPTCGADGQNWSAGSAGGTDQRRIFPQIVQQKSARPPGPVHLSRPAGQLSARPPSAGNRRRGKAVAPVTLHTP